MEKPFYKKPVIWIIGLIIIMLFLGASLVFKGIKKAKVVEDENTPTPQETLPTIDPSIQVSLTSREDKKAVILKIADIPNDITTIDYELTYEAKGGLPRGVLGRIDLKETRSIEREILLGTCSRNTCVYDEGVAKISVVLRFNGSQGRRQFQKEFPL